MGACQYFEPRRGTWPAWAGRRRRHRRCRWLTASNLCRRNSERGRNGARHRNSERSFASRAHRRRRSVPAKEAGMAWLPRAPGLHPICSFATLVPVVVAKCTTTPRRSHAGLPAPPLEITPGMFSFRVVHKSTVAALVERACSAQVTLHLVRSDKLDQAGRRAAMAAGAAMIISCTTTSRHTNRLRVALHAGACS